MLKLIYNIDEDKFEDELNWLHELKVYPSYREIYQVDNFVVSRKIAIGVIVSNETALSIKLRHDLCSQKEYRK